MMNPKRRFKKADGTIFADWKNVPFANIFQEYNVKNTACLPQYTAGKYGLKPIDNEKIRYNIQNHKAFSINSLILGIGIEEVGVATNYPGCVSPIYTTYQIQDHKANSLFIAYYIKNVFAKNKGRITHKSTRREYEFEPTELKKIDIPLPDSLEEQEKIANFLFEIDNLIASAEAEIEKTKNFKKAMLQKMFPKDGESVPEIRFPGFTDDWEQRMLSDFAIKAVDNIGKTPPLSEEGTHPLIEVAALGNGNPDYSKVEKYLDDYSFRHNLRDYIKEGDILFSTVGSIGLVSLMDSHENAVIAQNIVAFRAKQGYLPKFLYSLFSTAENQERANRIVMGAVQPSIKVSQLVDVEYYVTNNIKEQRMLGEMFYNLDNLITLHQSELEKLQKIKKSLLERMFV